VGTDVLTGGPGTWACAPRDVPHTLADLGSVEARVLCLFAPGGFERRFERVLAQDGEGLQELAEAERLTRLVGPPLTSPTRPAPLRDHPDQSCHVPIEERGTVTTTVGTGRCAGSRGGRPVDTGGSPDARGRTANGSATRPKRLLAPREVVS